MTPGDFRDAAEALAGPLGHRFADEELLRQALTHPSAAAGGARRGPRPYERLEFLGDRVLGLVVAHMLYAAFPRESEGALAKRLAALVRREAVARVAETLGLGRYVVLSRGEAESGGRSSTTLLADALEAVIGALYLDGGLPAAEAFVRRHWESLLHEDARPPQDAKTALQEWAQGAGLPLPDYELVASEGPPHSPLFRVAVHVAGRPPAHGAGRSKQAAQQAAAAAMLERIAADPGDG
ncbi:MAG: ribonuclease III [Rhodospirillaceae bacterium]|nr:ribonuclease III [Rhodospirillaceae bacterium]